MALAQVLFAGSRKVASFTTMDFVEPLYIKGFPFYAKIEATYIPDSNEIYFRVYESATEVFPNYSYLEGTFKCSSVTDPISTAINAYTVSVTGINGSVALLKIRPDVASYGTFIQSHLIVSSRIKANISQVVEFLDPVIAVSGITFNSTTQSNFYTAKTLFDKAYFSEFSRTPNIPAQLNGITVYQATGFSTGKSWFRLYKDLVGDMFLALATNSATGALVDFGTPVKVLKNNGTAESPVYASVFDPEATIDYDYKYWFSLSTYYVSGSVTPATIPYLVVSSKDQASSLAFSANIDQLHLAQEGVYEMTFAEGNQYLCFVKTGVSGVCLGGSFAEIPVRSPYEVIPTKNITGVKVLSIGGVSFNSVRLKQTVSSGNVYLSLSETNPTDNPLSYGDQVDVTKSGLYILNTPSGGSALVTTNSMFYNMFNGSEVLVYNYSTDKVFGDLLPGDFITGKTEYRCIALRNTNTAKIYSRIKLWFDYNCNSVAPNESSLDYFMVASPLGVPEVIPNETTAPTALAAPFGFVDAESSSLVFDNVKPNDVIYLWLKRVTQPRAQPNTVVDILSYMRLKVYS